jgi:prolyl-tRNA synthetase
LIGIPVRVNVGDRSLKKGVLELKVRREEERHDVPVEEVVDRVVAEIAKLQEELDAGVTEVEYKE